MGCPVHVRLRHPGLRRDGGWRALHGGLPGGQACHGARGQLPAGSDGPGEDKAPVQRERCPAKRPLRLHGGGGGAQRRGAHPDREQFYLLQVAGSGRVSPVTGLLDPGWPGRGRVRGVYDRSAELQRGPEAGDRLQRPGRHQLPLGDWDTQG